jgi:FixJ family two-component response regulator
VASGRRGGTSRPEPGPASAEPAARTRVYIVDDDEILLGTLARVLLRAGHDVETYATPRAFLDRARPEPTSCVLLDIQMPGLSGLELQALLARDRAAPAVVFISAHADVPAAVRAMKGGAVDLLQKPFENSELLEAVGVALRRSAERAALQASRATALERLARLTRRERQVAELIGAGRKSRDIAADLGLAETTVSLHRARVMKKLGVSSLAELVLLVERAESWARGS